MLQNEITKDYFLWCIFIRRMLFGSHEKDTSNLRGVGFPTPAHPLKFSPGRETKDGRNTDDTRFLPLVHVRDLPFCIRLIICSDPR